MSQTENKTDPTLEEQIASMRREAETIVEKIRSKRDQTQKQIDEYVDLVYYQILYFIVREGENCVNKPLILSISNLNINMTEKMAQSVCDALWKKYSCVTGLKMMVPWYNPIGHGFEIKLTL